MIGRIIGFALLGAVVAIPVPFVGPVLGAMIGGGIAYFVSRRGARNARDTSLPDHEDLDRKRLAQRLGVERVDGRFYLGHESYDTLEEAIAAGERNRLSGSQA